MRVASLGRFIMEITQPDDFHVHVRDGNLLKMCLPFTANLNGKAIIMPNTRPPIRTAADAASYRERILACLAPEIQTRFTPLMTLYLTDATKPEDIVQAKQSAIVFGVKLYPAGATTNSDSGVTSIKNVFAALAKMEEVDLPLLIHGEAVDVDIFDRERIFMETQLGPILQSFPKLRVVVEHVTTKEMVEFVRDSEHKRIAATITPHHLLYNRNDLFKPPPGKGHGTALNPHLFCLPVLKAQEHQQALIDAAISGNPRFFAGSDTAPHPRSSKECDCCSAGVFAAPTSIEVYTTVFEQHNALDKLEAFLSHFGSDFYQLPRNAHKIRLEKAPFEVPKAFAFGDGVEVVSMAAKQTLNLKATFIQ
jgi:dihydroorotase